MESRKWFTEMRKSNNIVDLRQRITYCFQEIRKNPNVFQRIQNFLDKRIRACIRAEDDHFDYFEHLI